MQYKNGDFLTIPTDLKLRPIIAGPIYETQPSKQFPGHPLETSHQTR